MIAGAVVSYQCLRCSRRGLRIDEDCDCPDVVPPDPDRVAIPAPPPELAEPAPPAFMLSAVGDAGAASYLVVEEVLLEDGSSEIEEHELPGIPSARCRSCWRPMAHHGPLAECPASNEVGKQEE